MVSDTVIDLLLSVAVAAAVVVELTLPALAAKLPDAEPAAIDREAGTVSALLLSDS